MTPLDSSFPVLKRRCIIASVARPPSSAVSINQGMFRSVLLTNAVVVSIVVIIIAIIIVFISVIIIMVMTKRNTINIAMTSPPSLAQSRVLLERTLKTWGIWHTFNTAAAAAAVVATAAAAAAAHEAAAKLAANRVVSLLSPSKGKFGSISSRFSVTPRSSPREGTDKTIGILGDKSLGLYSMNDVTVVW